MRDLRDKADTGPDATRMSQAEGKVEIIRPALYDADEISDEGEFPIHGDWIETDEGWLECPAALAQILVTAVDERDVSFPVVVSIESKTIEDESWTIEATVEEAE